MSGGLPDLGPVIPVVTIDDDDLAAPLARALLKGGLRSIEVTLRTPAALRAIERIAEEVPEIVLLAGTVVSEAQAHDAGAAGAQVIVTPGATPRLLDALLAGALPFIAGCATPSEAIALLERDITCAKLFPAKSLGGPAAARAFAGPFPTLRLCPTGGVDAASAAEYLQLPNVLCVGGTWIAQDLPPHDGDWSRIVAHARAAAELARPRLSQLWSSGGGAADAPRSRIT
jgi:2-dehydro-3-deoxyphosphogluconate aldolase / (4S)-4-hydroxy-2-oxoglutarate aldolase